mmetsp:Transcript_22031/g.23600  ORF Transcript_22031/g.23600 Transcript_22031/m.23600 type:complete len:102 (+) Transcript_22031:417-722(+)
MIGPILFLISIIFIGSAVPSTAAINNPSDSNPSILTLLLINFDTDNNNDSDTVPSSCDPDEALQVCCFSTDSIITTAASPTTSPVATAANSPTVYVQKHIF